MKNSYSGKCLCGSVTYQANCKPVIVAQCHCEECRRLSGTGHTVGAMFPKIEVDLDGELTKYRYQSRNGSKVTKAFCSKCGSPMFGTNSKSSDHMTISLGTMDDATGLEIQVVIFERDQQHWDQLGSDVMSFATQPDWKPET